MIKNKIKPIIFYGILYLNALVIIIECLLDNQNTDVSMGIFMLFLVGCIVMGMLAINSGSSRIDLTDAIMAFVFIEYGRKEATYFAIIFWLVIGLVNKEVFKRRRTKIFFNTIMFMIITYATATIISYINRYVLNNIVVNSFTFIGLFLIINIVLIKLRYVFMDGTSYKLGKETRQLLFLNFMASSIITIMLTELMESKQQVGIIILLLNLITLHYCFYIYRKLEFRNEATKKLLKITGDMVKPGEFIDKCNNLLKNLKELIPYDVCAIYTFDSENDTLIYPISYVAPQGLGIGDLSYNISSESFTSKVVNEGKLYISKDTKRDKRIKADGKLNEITEAAILSPVSIEGRVVGLIAISGGLDLEVFLENGVEEILEILSNQIALAIENDRIYSDIKNKADEDHLTKLYNRRTFDREIDALIASEAMFSFVIYDIDDFKRVNDTYGHLIGDEVLKLVCNIIKKSIRKTDIACRYGGEEIVILFKDLSKNDAYIISDRIRDKINTSFVDWYGKKIRITVSGGVSSYPDDGSTKSEIISHADEVLYSLCKNMGKNVVRVYDSDFQGKMGIDI